MKLNILMISTPLFYSFFSVIEASKVGTLGKKYGTAKQNNSLKKLSLEQLEQAQQKAMQKKDFTLAIKYLKKRMDQAGNDPTIQAHFLFELGEINFEAGKFDEAIQIFEKFKRDFSQYPRLEEVHYKSCLSSYLNMLDAHRDQTNTEQTIILSDQYLNHPRQFKKYTIEVKAFKAEALKNRAQHEILICKSYKRQGRTKEARRRVDYLEKQYLDSVPELATEILALKEELYPVVSPVAMVS